MMALTLGILCGLFPLDVPNPVALRPPAIAIKLVNEVEGTMRVAVLLPEGTRVKKGDVVCELDSLDLRDSLQTQVIATRKASADFEKAKGERASAEAALAEERESIALELDSLRGRITLAGLDREVADSEIEAATKAKDDGKRKAAEADKLRAELAAKEAEGRIRLIEKFVRARRIAEAEARIGTSNSTLLAREQKYELEKAKEAKLRKLIAKCRVFAPVGGMVARSDENDTDPDRPRIRPGTTVREGTILLRLLPD